MSGPRLLETGIYTVPEIARLVRARQSIVRVWIEGRKGRQLAVIDNELGRVGGRVAVSFANLMELRFVATFHAAGIGLREIRSIMDEAKSTLNHPHPFATRIIFRTDGKEIVAQLIRNSGVYQIYDLKTRNYELPEVVIDSMKGDVRYDPHGDAISWYPRRAIAPHVVVHPMFSFGRPILERSRIPTETLADAVRAEGNARSVAILFDINEKQVREAIRFEQDLRHAA